MNSTAKQKKSPKSDSASTTSLTHNYRTLAATTRQVARPRTEGRLPLSPPAISQRKKSPELTVSQLKALPYEDYLQTGHWKRVRKQKLQEAGWRCQVCNSNERLNVHHRRYINRGFEKMEDLLVMCGGEKGCHTLFHSHRKIRY